ncbi:hypothetical protein SynMITS9220_03047 [Synechococcus sp. MIT S9220]|nr:hypothetical protein SynMITS9220_03047 [Synechococcus sp. MIT S9220]
MAEPAGHRGKVTQKPEAFVQAVFTEYVDVDAPIVKSA